MRQSRQITRTLKETPRDAHTVSHQLMLRAGLISQLSAGIYSYLPLLYRTLRKIEGIVAEEMDRAGAEQLLMPALQPKELWVESERWERYTDIDGIMFAFEDRRGSTVCLGPTHEEVITDIVRRSVESYKDLPVNLYQIQTKFRDEIRPRFGLMRAREFIMKDAYSFDVDQAGLDKSFDDMDTAYRAILNRIGLDFRSVEADSGAIGGSGSKEFMVLAQAGEDTILLCDSCEYAANSETAESLLEEFEQDSEEHSMEEVHGEGLIGVDILAEYLKIPVWKTTKTILFDTDAGDTVAVMVRGDTDVNEIKVLNHLGVKQITLTAPEKIKELTGAEVGYAGPIGLPEGIRVIADNYCAKRVNFECGANKTDYHNINVNFGRDLKLPEFGDFKLAAAGHCCPRCKTGKLKETEGIEVGHIFKLGKKYSEAMKCFFLDKDGKEQPMEMGCYGIGVSRIASSVIEQSHDENGIIWPLSVAPYQIHLIGLNLEKEEIRTEVDKIYEELIGAGLEVLYDDRELRAGEKFADADLIGIPLRITVSKRAIKNGSAEVKERKEAEAGSVGFGELVEYCRRYVVEGLSH